jgi:hypothetical protein
MASRAYQSTAADALREQVPAALGALLDGFQSADRLADGAILGGYRDHLGEVYNGLVTALLRCVFVLFAEARSLLPIDGELPAGGDSLARLHAQLARDRRRHGAALDDRHGAWERVLRLFRALHDGVPGEDGLLLSARGGHLFDPDAFPFLEGRPRGSARRPDEILAAPRVSDGVVLRILDLLRTRGGARIRYEGLDVEQLGSAYEGLMGFDLEVSRGDSLAVRPGEARRKTGSHYTPRSLTSPIVATALRAALKQLGPRPTAAQILDLAICDPAMGSGAFLVEACRQLAPHLVTAWRRGDDLPALRPDEAPLIHARRLIALRCLHGVDRNPLAVELARLSLWLLTLAREHPFTFVDHALRRGDSLVGLSREQIESACLGRDLDLDLGLGFDPKQGHGLGDPARNSRLDAEVARTVGDAMIACHFNEGSDSARRRALRALTEAIPRWLAAGEGDGELRAKIGTLRAGTSGIEPFHWAVEFPEVFSAGRGGFDVFLGNPPFLGGRNLSGRAGEAYSAWLVSAHEGANGAGDLVAHFFRRAFDLLRPGGVLGFIATNTIAQGDTRAMGLRWICGHGGTIFAATRRLAWPGSAAVVVSTVHLAKGPLATTIPPRLDGRRVPRISAFLLPTGGDDPPAILASNQGKSFVGSIALGMGFTFDDDNPNATPLAEMNVILARDPRSRERVFPYLGGEEVNTSPRQLHRRYIIDFGELTEAEARSYPDLFAIVEARVRPERQTKDAGKYPRMVHEWWKLWNARVELHRTARAMRRVLGIARVSRTAAFTFLPSSMVYSEQLVIFAFEDDAHFALLQSRIHEEWARFLGSSMRDDLRYTPSDCFETFPFAAGCATNAELAGAGRAYHEHRAALMLANDEGLTRTTHRFHDPAERSPSIGRLRELHAAMDRAALDAYGWSALAPDYAFRAQLDGSVRYTWSDEIRAEILARLMDENQRRSRAESAGSSPASSAR